MEGVCVMIASTDKGLFCTTSRFKSPISQLPKEFAEKVPQKMG